MTTMNTERAEVPAWVLTALGAAGQAIAVAVVIAVGSVGGQVAGLGAYLFAVGFGALLLLRSWAPATVLVLTVLGTFAYYVADYPPIGMAVPVFGALYNAAERGRVVVASVAGAVLLVVALYFRIQDGESSAVLAYDVITNAALIGCAIALALTVRSRRHLGEERERAVRLERAAQQERAARQVEEQRLQLARDVHDSLGHALTLVSVQARVAHQVLDTDREAAVVALDRVASAAGSSLTDLRRTLDTLRSDRDGTGHAPITLAGIERTAQAARDAGLDVDLVVDVAGADAPGPVASAAFRIVQESITNVLRHAQATRVRIEVRAGSGVLHLEVADDGRGMAADRAAERHSGGRGIAGMQDRAELLGGTFTTSERGGGVTVTADLPLGEAP
ncbi:sensor histidine kinase [Ornithinimicrobium faecis]|uniref:histidine kinase n=1 Tax=Ornithinimicrobium faecis TaxID=2934158 RepID=A0ABY4YPZ9_9MICO|nr:sensor histidine kinase [Ornithinimicrobium sp. HY1793]USQ78853.1 sensor histidine kinase [Ornithinimicrobium sp. HY1793]